MRARVDSHLGIAVCVLPLLCIAAVTAESNTPLAHCPNADGAFIGLASDGTYNLRYPVDASDGNSEKWALVDEKTIGDVYKRKVTRDGSTTEVPQPAAVNSFTGKYVQVLPDDGDGYSDIFGVGSFRMTGLDYQIDVAKSGVHNLYLRWTGGDTYGGGDSLYAVMREAETDAVVPGMPAMKPKMVPIEDTDFAGYCYSMKTHGGRA